MPAQSISNAELRKIKAANPGDRVLRRIILMTLDKRRRVARETDAERRAVIQRALTRHEAWLQKECGAQS